MRAWGYSPGDRVLLFLKVLYENGREKTGGPMPTDTDYYEGGCACGHVRYRMRSQPLIGHAVRFIRVGTLDDPSKLPPDVHIYTSAKQPWLTLPPDASRLTTRNRQV